MNIAILLTTIYIFLNNIGYAIYEFQNKNLHVEYTIGDDSSELMKLYYFYNQKQYGIKISEEDLENGNWLDIICKL